MPLAQIKIGPFPLLEKPYLCFCPFTEGGLQSVRYKNRKDYSIRQIFLTRKRINWKTAHCFPIFAIFVVVTRQRAADISDESVCFYPCEGIW